MMSEAKAYVYSGQWVADCVRSCGNTEHLFVSLNPRNAKLPRVIRLHTFSCSYCGMSAPIDWPPNRVEIDAVLSIRPVPHTRNWYPKGHPTAVRHNLPDGQTIDELLEEGRKNGVL